MYMVSITNSYNYEKKWSTTDKRTQLVRTARIFTIRRREGLCRGCINKQQINTSIIKHENKNTPDILNSRTKILMYYDVPLNTSVEATNQKRKKLKPINIPSIPN
jgi:hypothetical protein